MTKKIDITSTAVEKGLDAAISFADKLIMPAIEETGLLIKDQVTMFRFKNQIRMLNKAKEYCEKHKVQTKTISFKLLSPLLDYSGLEENPILQDKWAILLANMVDSDQNIENHVFPYVLSQLSINEFLQLEKVYDEKVSSVKQKQAELDAFKKELPLLKKEVEDRLNEINEELKERAEKREINDPEKGLDLTKERIRLETKLKSFSRRELDFRWATEKPPTLPYNGLKQFELSNVIRLGLVKEEKNFYASSQTLEIPNERNEDHSYTKVDLDIEVQSDVDHNITELGELFFNACKEKHFKGTE